MLTFRGRLKSPWSYRRRKHALLPRQWKHLFTTDGKLRDGVKFLKKVRSGVSDSAKLSVCTFFSSLLYNLKYWHFFFLSIGLSPIWTPPLVKINTYMHKPIHSVLDPRHYDL